MRTPKQNLESVNSSRFSVLSAFQAQSMRAPVASSTAQRMRLNQSTGTRVLRCEPSRPPGMEPIKSEATNRINIANAPVHDAGYAGKHHRVHNVGPHHHFWGVAVEQEQEHHDDAA